MLTIAPGNVTPTKCITGRTEQAVTIRQPRFKGACGLNAMPVIPRRSSVTTVKRWVSSPECGKRPAGAEGAHAHNQRRTLARTVVGDDGAIGGLHGFHARPPFASLKPAGRAAPNSSA